MKDEVNDFVNDWVNYFVISLVSDLAAKPKNNNDQPCNNNSIAIKSPGNHKLDDGKLFMMSTPINIEIAADRASQNHSAKWRCWNAETKRKKPVIKKIAANHKVIASSAGIGNAHT